jgi:diguanylate cyclase (GGDEF)-like protein
MKRHFSVITRLSLLLTLLAALIMLALMMAVDDSLKRFQQNSVETDQAYMARIMRNQLEHDALLLVRALGDNLGVEIYNRDLSAIGQAFERLDQTRALLYFFIYDRDGLIIHDGSASVQRFGAPVREHTPTDLRTGMSEHLLWQQDQLHLNTQVSVGAEPLAGIAVGFDYSQAMASVRAEAAALEHDEQGLFQDLRRAILITFVLLLPICMLSARWLTRALLSPLQTLTERSVRYADGERELSFELHRDDELGRLGSALERMRQALEQSHQQVHQMAYEDAVTGLPNRRWFQHKLNEVMHRCASVDSRFAVLFIDLDHFKQVNDTAGHERGDHLLREVSRRLRATLNAQHNRRGPEPLLARLGGDEFVILLPGIQTSEEGADTARALAAALASPFLLNGQYFSISCSIGITVYPDDGVSASEILKHADIAMYSAKQHGRNQFAFFQRGMTEDLRERLEIQQGIRDAIDADHLFLEYQPIFDLQSGRMRCAEALLRWQHPEQGLISPARFIPIIEESDLIEDVTRWVARRAMRDLKPLLERDPAFSVSINISGAAVHQLELCDHICQLKEAHSLPDGSLCIELTETSMISHLERSETALRRWKAAGIEIWVDDFGTGYSSLAYLNSLSIDGLKIDRSFVHNLIDGHSKPLIDAMVALADSLSIETVAEGVETEQQRETLTRMGVTFGQGFGLARPMRIEQLSEQLVRLRETMDV